MVIFWHKIAIIASIPFLLIGCRKEAVINCDEITLNGLGIMLNESRFISSSECIMEVIYEGSSVVLKSEQINYIYRKVA